MKKNVDEGYFTTIELQNMWGYGDKKVRSLLNIAKKNGILEVKPFTKEGINGQKCKSFKYRIRTN